MADGYLHADDTYIVLCAWYEYECYATLVQGAILRTKTALGYRQSHAARPIAFADLPRLDFALHFALTGVERERDAPCSTLAHESLRTSAPRSSYHSKQRLHYSTCAFAQLMPCHDIPIQASREVTSTFQSCPLQSNVVFDLVLLTQRMESNGI